MRLRSSPPNEGVLVPVDFSRMPNQLVEKPFSTVRLPSAPNRTLSDECMGLLTGAPHPFPALQPFWNFEIGPWTIFVLQSDN